MRCSVNRNTNQLAPKPTSVSPTTTKNTHSRFSSNKNHSKTSNQSSGKTSVPKFAPKPGVTSSNTSLWTRRTKNKCSPKSDSSIKSTSTWTLRTSSSPITTLKSSKPSNSSRRTSTGLSPLPKSSATRMSRTVFVGFCSFTQSDTLLMSTSKAWMTSWLRFSRSFSQVCFQWLFKNSKPISPN